ncbi:MAG: hypothetical protein M1829_003723 [Trizodia sp. TS-e1964]|nr:MAG: hypothetical protein M1829_003723 [Trizodia sp. TS-e1964]
MSGLADAPSILVQIRNPTSPNSLVTALRALKNELVGHEEKKEAWMALGIIDPLQKILMDHGSKETEEPSSPSSDMSNWSERDLARLEATIIIGSLCQGGANKRTPTVARVVGRALLSALSPAENPALLIVATLQTWNTIASSAALAFPDSHATTACYANILLSTQNGRNLAQILSQSSAAPLVQQQISLVAALITKLCCEERHQASLSKSGVLDALATRLASFVVSTGFTSADTSGLEPSPNIPPPAPKNASLDPLLEAVAAAIQGSQVRATEFLCSPAILAVLPSTTDAHTLFDTSKARYAHPVEFMLPYLPNPRQKVPVGHAPAFPPLGSNSDHGMGASRRAASSQNIWMSSSHLNLPEPSAEDESPVVAWLIHICREQSEITRLMAAALITRLYRAGLVSKKRETAIALLIVPLLVQMLDENITVSNTSFNTWSGHGVDNTIWKIQEYAPEVLAMLIRDSKTLQKAAFEPNGQSVKKLCAMLKATHTPTDLVQLYSWSPAPDGTPSQPSTGELSPLALHKVKVRASALSALAAIALFDDNFRRVIIDNGVIGSAIESMKPFDRVILKSEDPSKREKALLDGNPTPVLVAACGVLRSLSRSVAILRTSLIDAGVASPIFSLLSHWDPEVQIAASAAVCNLVLEFSPMKDSFTEAGVMDILCNFARCHNSQLRLNAVWALKHLVFATDKDFRMACVKHLGETWLLKLVSEDIEANALARNSGRYGIMAVDNIVEEQESDADTYETDEGFITEEDGSKMVDSIGALSQSIQFHNFSQNNRNAESTETDGLKARIPSPTKNRLVALREAETDPVRKAIRDDMAVQEQALDLIRNLICGPPSVDMIDFIFEIMGSDQLFGALVSKLKPRPTITHNRERKFSGHGNEARNLQPQSEILVPACYILVHIAAGHPKHRQLLISQSELLELLLNLYNHPNKDVRVALVWIVINLTWEDDSADHMACRKRADELKRLGFKPKIEILSQDPETDIRERCKTALAQLRET